MFRLNLSSYVSRKTNHSCVPRGQLARQHGGASQPGLLDIVNFSVHIQSPTNHETLLGGFKSYEADGVEF
jgi:hypothetical protein